MKKQSVRVLLRSLVIGLFVIAFSACGSPLDFNGESSNLKTAQSAAKAGKGGPDGKVTICHYDGQGVAHTITVSTNAVDSHFKNHGDHGLLTFYRDADGDGYGNSSDTVSACAAPAGYVTRGGDCNDNDASVNPSATEACKDNVDNNCNGKVDEGCVGCAKLLLHCSAGSSVLQTICGAGPHVLPSNVARNISYVKFDSSTSGAILTRCGTNEQLTITNDTNLCSLRGGCCGSNRWNDTICSIKLF